MPNKEINLTTDDLIHVLRVQNSQLEYVENPTGLAFPCSICKHASLPESNPTCSKCDHSH